jgi:hypothetical protein
MLSKRIESGAWYNAYAKLRESLMEKKQKGRIMERWKKSRGKAFLWEYTPSPRYPQ